MHIESVGRPPKPAPLTPEKLDRGAGSAAGIRARHGGDVRVGEVFLQVRRTPSRDFPRKCFQQPVTR